MISTNRLKQLAAEIIARQIDEILTTDQDNSLGSARHILGIEGDDMKVLLACLEVQRAALRKQAGSIRDLANREIRVKWGLS